jgi:hypothetical protein
MLGLNIDMLRRFVYYRSIPISAALKIVYSRSESMSRCFVGGFQMYIGLIGGIYLLTSNNSLLFN